MSTNNSIEIWKPIPGYGGYYEASSEGRIRVKDRIIVKKHSMTGRMTEFKYKGKLLNPSRSDKFGHMNVTLGIDGVDYKTSVHRLVLMTFVGPRPHGMEACHNNGIASDNRLTNLRWDTHLANNRDRCLHGTYLIGEVHKMAKLKESQAREIKNSPLENNELMAKYSISRSQVCRIRKGSAWPHLSKTIEALNA